MKADIHPAYGEITVNCSCGNSFPTRSTVGKDLFAVGVMAGVGYDWFGGAAILRVPESAAVEDFEARRTVVFGGASMNFLVVQLSAEAGVTRGFQPVAGYVGPFDPRGSTFFGSLAFRLTL